MNKFLGQLLVSLKLAVNKSGEFVDKGHLDFPEIPIFMSLDAGVYLGDGVSKDRVKLIFD